MDNGVLVKINNSNPISSNMGATSNSNSSRLAALHERKKSIEEALFKKEIELRELCFQESDITGIIPSEMPLQPGESPPTIRRKIGTSYTLPESLIKPASNKDEEISDLELQLQLHANLAEAALGLAHKQNLSKTLRRQHKSEYQEHKKQYKGLQEKIIALKEAQALQQQQQQTPLIEQQKQKKKPRPPEQDDGISIKSNEPFCKSEHRQSVRSLRYTLQTDNIAELYQQFTRRSPNRNLDISYDMGQSRHDDLSSSFYKLNFSGYKSYMDRHDMYEPMQLAYNHRPLHYQHLHESPTYQQHGYQYNNHSHTNHEQGNLLHQQNTLPQSHSHIQHLSPNNSELSNNTMNPKYFTSKYFQNTPHLQSYSKYAYNNATLPMSRQSSPNMNINKYQLSNTPVPSQHSPLYKNHSSDPVYHTLNPHQLQPHQQYEQNTGLGGCWKKKENGEVIWCNSSNSIDSNWQRDKGFGSLDRRKNRRIQKRLSPKTDNKTATLPTIPHSSEKSISPQVQTRHSQDRQLIRTQSLGSVGVQTFDNIWPSDDNSSCDSESRSIHERSSSTIRRQKQKEWRETSLDSPGSPTLSIVSRCHSALLPISQEENFGGSTHSIVSHINTKIPLEIPAESNPSPRIPDTNLEIFNNNIPKNCTLVQAGHCKPYHEETKPFEMSDFYKYSTKFKKSPSKNIESEERPNLERPSNLHKNLNEHFGNLNIQSSDVPQNHVNLDHIDNVDHIIATNNEHYPQDIHAWYNSQPYREKENNNATLV